MKPRLSAAILGSACVLVLASTFYAWRFAYFWLDDFNNLYWVQQQSLRQMLSYNLNPFSDFFRPFGMLVYWILWHSFGLNAMPYHLLAWTLHAANAVLLYVLLSRIAGSRYAAAAGVLVFSFRSNFADIYWSFGSIFELLALLFVLLALLIYSGRLSYSRIALVGLLYFLAIRSKEMAITLPIVLLLYDLCIRREKFDRRRVVMYAAMVAFTAVWGYGRFVSMGSSTPDHPYYMDFSAITAGRGYGWYFDHLYGLRLRWAQWLIAAVLLAAAFVWARERRGLFFIGYIFVTLIPVLFLVNHRYEMFWYIPFFGVAGLCALLAAAVERRWRSEFVGVVAFVLVAFGHYMLERAASAELLRNEQSIAIEYAAFVQSVESLPPPVPGGAVLIQNVPRYFTPEVLTSAVQVVMRRTDIRAEVVR